MKSEQCKNHRDAQVYDGRVCYKKLLRGREHTGSSDALGGKVKSNGIIYLLSIDARSFF